MLKKTITYTNYNDEVVTEDFYFNLSKAEIIEMEAMTDGGLRAKLTSIVAAKDQKKIMETFKEILFKAYGEKSPDGKRFVKSKEISEGFEQTEAYSELFMEIVFDAEKAAAFINAIVPQETRQN